MEGTGNIGPNRLPKIKPVEPKPQDAQAPEQAAPAPAEKHLPGDSWNPIKTAKLCGVESPNKTLSRMCGMEPMKTMQGCGIVPPLETLKGCIPGPVSTVIHPPIGTCFCPNPIPVPIRTAKGCNIELPKTIICHTPEPLKTIGRACGVEPPVKTAAICNITRTCFCPPDTPPPGKTMGISCILDGPQKTLGIACGVQLPEKTKDFNCMPATLGPCQQPEKTLGIACGIELPVKTAKGCLPLPEKTQGICAVDTPVKTSRGCSVLPEATYNCPDYTFHCYGEGLKVDSPKLPE